MVCFLLTATTLSPHSLSRDISSLSCSYLALSITYCTAGPSLPVHSCFRTARLVGVLSSTMSLLVRSPRDTLLPPRALYHHQPFRHGSQPDCEFPALSPPTFEGDCDGGVLDNPQFLSLPHRSHPTAPAAVCDDPLLLRCPLPPFDCLSAGSCLLTHSSDNLCTDSLCTRSDPSLSPITMPANRAAGPAMSSPAPSFVAVSISVAPLTSRDRDSRYDYRRIGRGSLPPPPWPFFSRSSSHERTSWTSLSAAAANKANNSTPPQTQPLRPLQQQHVAAKRVRVYLSGALQVVLLYVAHTCTDPVAAKLSSLPPAPQHTEVVERGTAPSVCLPGLRRRWESWTGRNKGVAVMIHAR